MAGLLSACLFAATFRKSGGWFDLARVDSLFMLLVLAAVYLARSGASRRSQVSAGLLAAAAILTKQNALVVLAPLLLLLLVSQARRSLLFVGTATVATAAVVLYLNLTTSGWFLYYCLVLLSHHPHVPGAFWRFWSHDLLPLLPLVVLSFAFLITEWRGWFAWNRHFALALLVGMLGSSWLVRAGVGAEANNLMPAFAGLAIGAGLALAAIPARWGGRSPLRQLQIEGAALCSLLLQFGLLVYRPGSQLPTRADRAAGESVVARLRAVPGEVFLPHHGYLARMAGKHEYAHTVAMDDVFLADRGPARDDLFAQLIAALNERRFAAVVLESDRRYARFVLPSYDIAEDLYSSDQVFYPVTGARLRPEYLCLPKRPGSAAPR
jgi:hypothetical protein